MKTILFVCTANIARSPMAEALFNQQMKEMGLEAKYQAESAGTWSIGDIPAALDGQRVMWDRGLDTSHHRSREVTREILEKAHLVLTMEQGQKEALRIEFKNQKDKIYLLSEIVGLIHDIDDPYNQGLEKFEKTAGVLEHILTQGMGRILELADASG